MENVSGLDELDILMNYSSPKVLKLLSLLEEEGGEFRPKTPEFLDSKVHKPENVVRNNNNAF
jgi:hypothetical protein